MNSKKKAKLLLDVVPLVMRSIRDEMREAGKDALTVPQFRIFNRLRRGPMSNQELSSWMGVSAPTMSRMLQTLVDRGLLAKKTDSQDRRSVTLVCTSKGLTLYRRIRLSVQGKFALRIARMSGEDIRKMEDGLKILKEMMI